ncbi:cell division protein ZapA [bacterium]|nr:cell division protein ZapA [bacterium]
MEQEGGILKINIYGTEYPIKSDSEANADYIREVAQYVDRKMREIDQSTLAKSSLKVAILAALNITDELFQERSSKKSLMTEVEDKIRNLSDSLDITLKNDTDTQ